MFELRIHGRAGQGGKLAAQLLAEAALGENKFIQAFPEYGPERSGAPVAAYVRIADREIRAHYPIIRPNAILVLDERLLELSDTRQGFQTGAAMIINSEKSADYFKKKYRLAGRVYSLPATDIALEIIKLDKPNTILLGYLIKLTKIIKISSLQKVVKKSFVEKGKKELVASNLQAIQRGYNFKK